MTESPQVLSVGSHVSILDGLQPRRCRTPSPPSIFPQPAVWCYWPHPSCKSSAKYARLAWCRASLLSNSTFLSVAGGLSTDQVAVFLLILLTDLRSWLYIQVFQGICGICSGKGLWFGWRPSTRFLCYFLCLGRLTPWYQQMNHVLEIHPGPSILVSWWSKEKIITRPKKIKTVKWSSAGGAWQPCMCLVGFNVCQW